MTARSSRAYRVFNLAAQVHLSLVFFVFGIDQPAAAQNVRTQWVARVNGLVQPPDNNTATKAIAGDSHDNVYVTGQITISKFNTEAVTIKYDPFGKVDQVNAFALDSKGNAFLAGSEFDAVTNFSNFSTLKFDSNGRILWERLYGPGMGPLVSANAIALDPSGAVYVTGQSTSPDGSSFTNLTTVKYDTNGNQKWAARYQGRDTGVGMTYLSLGKLAITGDSPAGSTGYGWVTIGYTQF
jgi:hypothetical protein